MTAPQALVTALLHGHAWHALDVDDDGNVLASCNESGTMQLVEIAPDGTRTRLTALPSSCWGKYVPGRRAVVVSHDTDGDERSQLSMLSLQPLPAEPVGLDGLHPLVHDREHIHHLHEVDATAITYSTNRRNDTDFDVVVRSLATGEEHVLYDLGGWVAEVTSDHSHEQVVIQSLSLQPASTKLELTGPGGTTPVTDPQAPGLHVRASFTADDDALLVTSSRDGEWLGVYRTSLDGQVWEPVLVDASHDILGLVSPHGTKIFAEHKAQGASRATIHDAAGAWLCDVALPEDCRIASSVWSAEADYVALTVSTLTRPTQVLLVDARTGAVRTLIDSAESFADGVLGALPSPEMHWVQARDGEQIPVFLLRAQGDPRQGATVIDIHGGPEGESDRSFNARRLALLLAGFNVVVPNVRGSAGYGRRWLSLDDGPLRLESVADLADIHAWLPSVGLDQHRAALFGGSYGGYMTLAGLTMQPDLWAGGVDIVGMSSLVTFLENTSPYRRAFREREYGSLEHDREMLVQASPMTHLHQLRAPLFIIHGANDPRVPLSEAEQIAAELERKGVRHELMVFHDEGHGLARRENRLAAYPKAIEFLQEVLG